MGSLFAETAKRESRKTFTENEHPAYASTGIGAAMDLFAVAGAMRNRMEGDIERMFANAFEENFDLALRLLFYVGDIREGLGERRTFRIGLEWLGKKHPEKLRPYLSLVPFFNRWDSLFVLENTSLWYDVVHLINVQLLQDETNLLHHNLFEISLCAKWCPSIGTSSVETRVRAAKLASDIGWSQKRYRKLLAALRRALDVVEVRMTAGEWRDIYYPGVPSKAMMNYRRAFMRWDNDRFETYLSMVDEGKAKINAGALFPYEIAEKYLEGERRSDVLDLQWRAMPDVLNGAEMNVVVMADVSGSMTGRPMASSVGLALYFAERNKGAFNRLFMTFSKYPQFVFVEKRPISENLEAIRKAHWGMNTNLHEAINKILRMAVSKRVPPEDMPKALLVISDMEIDQAVEGNEDKFFLEFVEEKYAEAGYEIPLIVFWNVNARQNTFLVDEDRKGVLLVGGHSPKIFVTVMDAISLGLVPSEAMRHTLFSPRYDLEEIIKKKN